MDSKGPSAVSPGPPAQTSTVSERWQGYLDADFFVTEGKKHGAVQRDMATKAQLDEERGRVAEWAKSIGLKTVLDQYRISELQLGAQAKKVADLRGPVEQWEQRVIDKQKSLNDVRFQGIPEAPERPPVRLFLVVGAALGFVFGLIGATTISSILESIWRADVADPQSFYMKWAVALGIFVGLVVGTGTIATREHAAGGGKFVRSGTFLMGLCFALGLSGYRFLQPGPGGAMQFHMSGIAIVLLFLEVGVLMAIELNNLVLLNAWEKFQKNNEEFKQYSGREKAQRLALEDDTRSFEDHKQRLDREYKLLEEMQRQDQFYKHATENIDAFKDYAAKEAMRGFDLGLGR